jgi:hypothetical protein
MLCDVTPNILVKAFYPFVGAYSSISRFEDFVQESYQQEADTLLKVYQTIRMLFIIIAVCGTTVTFGTLYESLEF